MSVLVFLIDTAFFVLVFAALLRVWLNGARISMVQQPGPFILKTAVTQLPRSEFVAPKAAAVV